MKISSKTVYPQPRSESRSGDTLTIVLMCAKADALTVFNSFTHATYYSTIGDSASTGQIEVNAWYNYYSSSIEYAEVYATINLIFSKTAINNVVIATGSSKSDPVYYLESTAVQEPIERHPNYRCIWNYDIYMLMDSTATGIPTPPSDDGTHWTTATDPTKYIVYGGTYSWNKVQPAPPTSDTKWVRCDGIEAFVNMTGRATKPFVESWLMPSVTLTSTVYVRSRANVSSTDIGAVGKLKAPPSDAYGVLTKFGTAAANWLVNSCTIQPSGEYIAITTKYLYNGTATGGIGWDTDVYLLDGSTSYGGEDDE